MADIKFTNLFICDLGEDSIILQLLREVEQATGYPLSPHAGITSRSMVIHYLRDYRTVRPIGKDGVDGMAFDFVLLKQKIKKLHETDIYYLCNEIAQIKGTGVEKISGMTLYVFLDRYLNDKQKKREPLRRGWIPRR